MIDTKRLATDAGYWDEVAPNGATHAIPKRGHNATGVVWFKRNSKCDWKVWGRYISGSFLRWCDSAGTSDGSHFIPRPTKAPEVEWDGEGAAPLGCTVKVWFNSAGAGYWEQGKVIAQDGSMTVVKVNGAYYGRKAGGDLIAPIRTKEQRQREEFKQWFMDNRWNDTEAAIDDFLSRYNLEPKP